MAAYSFIRNACFNRSLIHLDFLIGISSAIPPVLRRHSIRGFRSFQGAYGFRYAGFLCNVGSKVDMTTKFQSRKCHDKISSQCNLSFDEWVMDNNSLMTQTKSFEAFVDKTLLLNKSSVKNFSLSISSLSLVSRISEWVSYAIEHNVQLITLSVELNDPIKEIEIEGVCINLSDHLFTCKSLTVLNLTFNCNILQLCDEKLAANFFSSCPLLEKLCIIDSVNVCHPKYLIISHPQLKELTVDYYSSEGYLKISAPALAKFAYWGPQKDMIIEHMPSLLEASLNFFDTEASIDGVPNIFRALSTTEVLKLSGYFRVCTKRLPNVVSCLPTLWPRLNKLEITVPYTVFHYRVLASILKSSPCLTCLHIVFKELTRKVTGEETWDIMEEFSVDADNVANLETVHMFDLGDGKGQMEMIRILIENANSLKYIHLELRFYFDGHLECWTEFFNKLPTFTKASKHDIHVKFMAPRLEVNNTMIL